MAELLCVLDATTSRRGKRGDGVTRVNPHRKLATLFIILTGVLPNGGVLAGQESAPVGSSNAVAAGRVLRVALERPLLRLSKLKGGAELDGQLFRPLYSGGRLLLPQGTKVHIVVDHTQKQKRKGKAPTGILDRMERVRRLGFGSPTTYAVFLLPATLTLPDGSKKEMKVSFIRGGDVISLHPKGSEITLGDSSITGGAVQDVKDQAGRVKDAKKTAKQYRHPQVTLQIDEDAVLTALPQAPPQPATPRPETITIPTGTLARLVLLNRLSTSENKQGERFQARLEEPIVQDGHVILPQGCLFEGRITRMMAPRRLSRGGSMQLVFESVSLPEGDVQKLVASLSAVEAETSQAVKMDNEGGLKGGSENKKRAISAAAVAIVTGQAVDELTSAPIEAAIGAAAGGAVGPIIGVATGVFFYLAGKGKDIEIPEQTELEITFGRPMTIPSHLQNEPRQSKHSATLCGDFFAARPIQGQR